VTGPAPARILLEGRPGVGKTTVARGVVGLLRDRGISVVGFTTEEVRDGRRRVGFAVESADGDRATLAHVDLPGPPRGGKYGVDVEAFERVALPALRKAGQHVVVIDELGKMELLSQRFRDAVAAILDGDSPVVATIHAHRHPFTDGVKRRKDVQLHRVTAANRDELPVRIAELLGAGRGEP